MLKYCLKYSKIVWRMLRMNYLWPFFLVCSKKYLHYHYSVLDTVS